jgi:hypothetical protein
MKVLMELVGRTSSYWGKGANATSFETAPYLFIQGKGASYFCGSWLGRQMVQSCKFELGDFPFPIIGRDDPVAGKYYCGPWGENTMQSGMPLAVADGPNKELAVDFLQFLTTREKNARFNAGPCWLPSVIGADVPEEMKGFKLLIRGRSIGAAFRSSGLNLEFKRILQNFIGGTCGYDTFIKEMDSLYMEYAPKDYARDTSRAFARLVKLEELRDGIDSIRNEAVVKGKTSTPGADAKLQELYEYQLTGLNAIWAVRGASGKEGGNAQ